MAELCYILGDLELLGPREHSIMLLTAKKKEQIEQARRICQANDETLQEHERGTWYLCAHGAFEKSGKLDLTKMYLVACTTAMLYPGRSFHKLLMYADVVFLDEVHGQCMPSEILNALLSRGLRYSPP